MFKNYLKTAYKVLLRRKFYTFISLFGVAFTMVVLMVAVSLFDHVFGAFPPETKANRTLGVYMIQINSNKSVTNGFPGYGFLDRYVKTLTTPEAVSIHSFREQVVSFQNGQPVDVYLKRTDGEFWRIMDFRFVEGGPYTKDDVKNANLVAVINEATRDRYFDGRTAVGSFIEADGQRFRVLGVVENVPYLRMVPFSDIWVPVTTTKSDSYKHEFFGNFFASALLRSPADIDKAKAEFAAVLPRVEMPDKDYDSVEAGLETLLSTSARIFTTSRFQPASAARIVGILLGLALMFMLLPTVNLVNINVSRIIERASEIGVRKAFGASSWTLVAQFIVENVVLTLIGGFLGFIGSLAVLHAISASGLFEYASFQVNLRIFFYGLGLALLFGVLSGVYPAWKMSRLHPVQALRGGSL